MVGGGLITASVKQGQILNKSTIDLFVVQEITNNLPLGKHK